MTRRDHHPELLETLAGALLLLGVGLLVAGVVMVFGGAPGGVPATVVGAGVSLAGTVMLVLSDSRRGVTR